MSAQDDVVAITRQWVEKAENDLKTAVHTLKLGKDCPADTVCFHAQQCVEKYLKALLVSRQTAFRMTHDLPTLMRLLPDALRPALDAEQQERLTDYATVSRYPGVYEPISLREARQAVKLARLVRKSVRGNLPAVAVRR